MKVCTAVVLVLVSECAPLIQSFMTTNTPRPLELESAATATALNRFNGPSGHFAGVGIHRGVVIQVMGVESHGSMVNDHRIRFLRYMRFHVVAMTSSLHSDSFFNGRSAGNRTVKNLSAK